MKPTDIEQPVSGPVHGPILPDGVIAQMRDKIPSAVEAEVDNYLAQTGETKVPKNELKETALEKILAGMDKKSPQYKRIIESMEGGVDAVIALIQHDTREEIKNSADIFSLRERTTVDGLTGLLNKYAFYAICSATIGRLKRAQSKEKPSNLRVLVMDLDGFKEINDKYGHLAGDQILVQFAQRLKAVMKRESDAIARFGGDEYVALLQDTDKAGAEILANRILNAMNNEPFVIKNPDGSVLQIKLTISIGGDEYNWEENSLPMIDRADKALYRVKKGGRNGVEVN